MPDPTDPEEILADHRETAARMRAGLALCIWRHHPDGSRSLMATPVDRDHAEHYLTELRERGMDVEIVEQAPPYRHTDATRLWQEPLPHPGLEAKIARDEERFVTREAAARLALRQLPVDEVLRIARQHAAAGSPDDDAGGCPGLG